MGYRLLMVRQPETRYAASPDGHIAYQVVGDGPMDLVVVPGWVSHVDNQWVDPGWAAFVGERHINDVGKSSLRQQGDRPVQRRGPDLLCRPQSVRPHPLRVLGLPRSSSELCGR